MIGRDLIPEWMARGLCASIDPELWFPDKGGSSYEAKRICGQCPVRIQCLEDALSQDLVPPGIWGGLSERERRKVKQNRQAAA